LWQYTHEQEDLPDTHGGLNRLVARSRALSARCEQVLGENGILRHISTADSAMDINAILEKLDYPTLKFWGVSGGSYFGGILATLYPEKVERLISEGERKS
jgi:pimeloyl-ACP methyl ester carboxylesterase